MLHYVQGSDIKDYIARAIQVLGGVSELARIADVSERTVYAWKKGARYPSRSNLARLCQHFDSFGAEEHEGGAIPKIMGSLGHEAASPEVFVREPILAFPKLPQLSGFDSSNYTQLTGQGYSKVASHGGDELEQQKVPSLANAANCDLVTIPCLKNAGQKPAAYPFALDWLQRNGFMADKLRFLQVSGRGMEPTLQDRDMCVLDTGDKDLDDDGIYAIKHGEHVFIKRVCRVPEGYIFRGDNRGLDYQDFQVACQDIFQLWQVLGRVIWTGRNL